MTEKVRVDPSTCDTIRQGIMGILKVFTENLLVQHTELDWFHEPFLVHLQCTLKVKILDEAQVNVVTNHLGSKDTRVELGVVCDEILTAGTHKL